MKSPSLTASMEDYLEAIYHLEQEHQMARVKDIARRLKRHQSTVSGALKNLAERRLINYTPHGLITLTPEGARLAKEVERRHEALRDFFVKVLNIDSQTAEEAACLMEHAVPGLIVDRFIQFGEFLEICPYRCKTWLEDFRNFCQNASQTRRCEQCLSQGLENFEAKPHHRQPQTLLLPDLRPGQKGIVLTVDTATSPGQRVQELGITPGVVAHMEGLGPCGDPVEVKVKGYHLSLRREEAAAVTVEFPYGFEGGDFFGTKVLNPTNYLNYKLCVLIKKISIFAQNDARESQVGDSHSNQGRTPMTKSMRHMEINERAVIKAVAATRELGRRIRDMGLVPGTEILVVGRAPLQDPVALRLKGFTMALRNNEAEHITVETES